MEAFPHLDDLVDAIIEKTSHFTDRVVEAIQTVQALLCENSRSLQPALTS